MCADLNREEIILPNELYITRVQELLDDGHNIELTAGGNSMLPFIHGQKDKIEIEKAGQLKPGDIVLAKLPEGGYVIHRIIRIKGDSLTLMGDGNLKGTESCGYSDVLARVINIKNGDTAVCCDSPSFKFKSELWLLAKPLRRILLALYKTVKLK